jgi:hypothetical protein
MKLRAIALIALMSVLTFAANAQATRADLPAPDNFLGIATFPLWDGRHLTQKQVKAAAADSPGNTTCSFITNAPKRPRSCSATPTTTAKRAPGRSWMGTRVERFCGTAQPRSGI